jgi:hypothetical protein
MASVTFSSSIFLFSRGYPIMRSAEEGLSSTGAFGKLKSVLAINNAIRLLSDATIYSIGFQ